MLRGLGGAVAALAQQPVGRTQSQRGACQRAIFAGSRRVEDHELAGECDHRSDHRSTG
jgi:non-canonical (house-cleaning) NTP pyrophosphatase